MPKDNNQYTCRCGNVVELHGFQQALALGINRDGQLERCWNCSGDDTVVEETRQWGDSMAAVDLLLGVDSDEPIDYGCCDGFCNGHGDDECADD